MSFCRPHASRRTLAAVVLSIVLAGCGTMPSVRAFLTGGERSSAIKEFAEADTLLAEARYQDAVRAYAEFIRHYPTSGFADDAYLRIAHIYMYRPDPSHGWAGWEGASYTVARDTLLGMLEQYPRTDRRLEAQNWIRLLDTAIRLEDARESAQDSVTVLATARQSIGRSLTRAEAQTAALRRRVRYLETARDSLAAVNRQLAAGNARLEGEVRQIREESERMRRMLVELERRRSASP